MVQMLRPSLLENKGELGRCSHDNLTAVSQVERNMHTCMQTLCYPVSKQQKRVMSPSSNDMIHRGHLNLGIHVSGRVAPRLQKNNKAPASLKPQRGKYRISPWRQNSESASPALNNGQIHSNLAIFHLYPFLAKLLPYFHRQDH